MASFADNILDIRERAIYGGDVRGAIAEALTQIPGVVDDTLQEKEDEIIGSINDFRDEMGDRFNEQDASINHIQSEVNNRDLYIHCTAMDGGDVLMSIVNAQ